MINEINQAARYHLPGLFEFYDFYKIFLSLFRRHREYFYDWCDIGSIYGAPSDCLWGGGRVGFGDADPAAVFDLMQEYRISARLTFSNSLLSREHLSDRRCNRLCRLFSSYDHSGSGGRAVKNTRPGIIIHSDILLHYLKENYPDFYFVSSTTKVITGFEDLKAEVCRSDFEYVVPDFRLNRDFENLSRLSHPQKQKIEFLCNECCPAACTDRKACYENVSRKSLGEECPDHKCAWDAAGEGYRFSKAMENPCFISIDDIRNTYLPMGFSNFKTEGRSLGSAVLLEFLLYYMTIPEYRLKVREAIYLDSSLDLF